MYPKPKYVLIVTSWRSDSRTISVAGNSYTADHILIAVGGYPGLSSRSSIQVGWFMYLIQSTNFSAIPTTPGAEYGISSDGFFELEQLPK